MKERNCCLLDTVKILFVSGILLFSSNVSYSQWSFVPQIQTSGCQGVAPYVAQSNQLIAAYQVAGFPTRETCEQTRAQILAIRSAVEGCSIYFTCTPYTGSDLIGNNPYSSGLEASPLNNIAGVGLGGPNFTPSSFESVNMWIQDWQHKNGSLNNAVDITNLVTGDAPFDNAYTKEMDKMVTEKRAPKVDRDASADDVWGVVDPNYLKQWDPDKIEKTTASGRGVKQVVPEEKTDAVETTSQRSLASAVPIPEGGVSDEIEHPKIDAVTNFAKDAASLIGEVKGIGLGAQILLNANINLYSELAKAYDDGINHGKIISTSEILTNAAKNTISDAKGMVADAVTSGVTSTIATYGTKAALTIAGREASEAAIKQGVSLVTNASGLISDPKETTINGGVGAVASKITKTDVDGSLVVKSFELGQKAGETGKVLLSK